MSEHAGEKTEQATPRRLEEAVKRGQIARSAEVQTVFVLLAGLLALKMAGPDLWRQLVLCQTSILGHLHEIPITMEALPHYSVRAALVVAACVAPILVGSAVGGLLAGGIQNRFQTSSEALTPNWARLDPVEGLKRIFSARALVPTGISALKLLVVIGLSYSKVMSILTDATLYSATSVAGTASFVADAALSITWRVVMSLMLLAVLDYAYNFWRTNRDLMMTREEVRDEAKNSEGNPQVKARQRRRRTKTVRQMLLEIPKADVVVTNPTHLAVALRYDRKTMRAPKIIAKGSRLNALRIREIAARHQVPIIENKPLARMMFKYGRVGGEIPAQLYVAVAEVLAYVYRMNRYRYYAQENQTVETQAPATRANG
ncbi:MAG: EscU/YscU/HrcU family type III secretion system export apparatus switch protein [Verrucomicrobiota bacterium]